MKELKQERNSEAERGEHETKMDTVMEKLKTVEKRQQQMQNALSSGISCITEISRVDKML